MASMGHLGSAPSIEFVESVELVEDFNSIGTMKKIAIWEHLSMHVELFSNCCYASLKRRINDGIGAPNSSNSLHSGDSIHPEATLVFSRPRWDFSNLFWLTS